MVLLGALFLITMWAQVHTVPERPWDALMLAASPCVAAAALINWDLLAVALTAVRPCSGSRRQPALAGLLLGLGHGGEALSGSASRTAVPALPAGRRMADFGRCCRLPDRWLAANLPVLLLAPDAWRSFWNTTPTAAATSARSGTCSPSPATRWLRLNLISLGLFAIGCLGIAALIIFAPRRPRLGSAAFLVIAAFLMTNKVYSPQYVLWLLPLLILARPRWRDWLIFTAGELFYFVAIWWHLGG